MKNTRSQASAQDNHKEWSESVKTSDDETISDQVEDHEADFQGATSREIVLDQEMINRVTTLGHETIDLEIVLDNERDLDLEMTGRVIVLDHVTTDQEIVLGPEIVSDQEMTDQVMISQEIVLDQEMILHEIVLDQEMTDPETISEHERDLDQEKTGHGTDLDQEATLDQETVLSQEENHQTAPAENLEGTETSEKSLENEDTDIFWLKVDGQKRLATENYVEGNQVYGEKLYKNKKVEYRIWDPFRSKLAAALYIGLDVFPITRGTKMLYLGASTGTTVSHISDIVGFSGVIYAVEHASRVARDFLDRVANFRKNVVPILQDARHPKEYFSIYGKVDIVYSDIAQPDQTEIAITNCQMFLKDEGYLFLVIKTRSIDVTQSPRITIENEVKKLQTHFTVIQNMDLHPYDKDHALVVAKFHAKG